MESSGQILKKAIRREKNNEKNNKKRIKSKYCN